VGLAGYFPRAVGKGNSGWCVGCGPASGQSWRRSWARLWPCLPARSRRLGNRLTFRSPATSHRGSSHRNWPAPRLSTRPDSHRRRPIASSPGPSCPLSREVVCRPTATRGLTSNFHGLGVADKARGPPPMGPTGRGSGAWSGGVSAQSEDTCPSCAIVLCPALIAAVRYSFWLPGLPGTWAVFTAAKSSIPVLWWRSAIGLFPMDVCMRPSL